MSAIRLRSSRNRELGLLLLVAALVAVGFTSVLVARSGVVSSLSLTYAAAFLALLGVAHIALRVSLPDADPVLLPAAGLLVAVGIVEIYRLDPTRARDQAIWLAIGVGCFIAVLAALPDYRVLERYRYVLGVASLLALAATIISSYATGTVVNGARVWIRVGGLSFQPGEFAKLGLVLFMAAYLREKRELLGEPRATRARIRAAAVQAPHAARAHGRRRARAAGADERLRHVAALLRRVPRHALPGHEQGHLRGRRPRRVRARGLPLVSARAARRRARRHLAAPVA